MTSPPTTDSHSARPAPDGLAAAAPAPRPAVENWENEGGHLPSRPAAIAPSDVSPVIRDQAAESEDLAAMRTQFVADFAGGTMGKHHNSYEHRARVLRQLTGERIR